MHELTTLHEAIEAALRVAMPRVEHVEAFPEMDQEMPVPALLFALVGWRPAEDDGTGKSALDTRFQACVLVDATRKRAPLQAAILAAELTGVLRAQNWGLEFVEVAGHIAAWPDKSTPELDGYAVWVVEWTHVLRVGKLADWPDEAQRILFNIEPSTGGGGPELYDPDAELKGEGCYGVPGG